MSKRTPLVTPLVKLADRVPLETPLGIALSIGNVCDFKCIYCDFANLTEEQKGKNAYRPKHMSYEEFSIFAEQLKAFKQPLKQFTFVSHGETLLNKDLPKMIRKLKEDGTVDCVKVTTNANQLTKELSLELIDAGLDLLKISIQGITEDKYVKICQTKVNLEELRSKIRFFFEHRKQCKVYIKTLDVALDDGEEDLFYDMFSDMADNIFVEKCFGDMALSECSNKLGMYDENIKICPMPFYTVHIDVFGNLVPCCRVSPSVNGMHCVIANVFKKDFNKIWHEDMKMLQLKLLKDEVEQGHICKDCKLFTSITKEADALDGQVEEILRRYAGCGGEI